MFTDRPLTLERWDRLSARRRASSRIARPMRTRGSRSSPAPSLAKGRRCTCRRTRAASRAMATRVVLAAPLTRDRRRRGRHGAARRACAPATAFTVIDGIAGPAAPRISRGVRRRARRRWATSSSRPERVTLTVALSPDVPDASLVLHQERPGDRRTSLAIADSTRGTTVRRSPASIGSRCGCPARRVRRRCRGSSATRSTAPRAASAARTRRRQRRSCEP